MISVTDMDDGHNEKRNGQQAPLPNSVIGEDAAVGQTTLVLTTAELLDRLGERGVKNADIARALKVSPSRVTEMKKGERAVKLDEAAKLVAEFELESPPAQRVAPVPASIARLIVRYIAEELDCRVTEAHLLEISEDVRAFSEYASDPRVRGSLELAETFFQAMRLRHPKPE